MYLSVPLLMAASTAPATTPPKPVGPATASVVRGSVSACSAVTKADVAQALGLGVEKEDEQQEKLASTCTYTRRRAQVSVTVQRLQKKLNMETEMAALKASMPDSAVREASGLGDRAFFLDIPGAGTQLYVINGDSDFVMVSVLGFGEATQVSPAAEALVRKALGRL